MYMSEYTSVFHDKVMTKALRMLKMARKYKWKISKTFTAEPKAWAVKMVAH